MADGFRFEKDDAGIKRVANGPGVAHALDKAAAKAEGKIKALAGNLSAGAFLGFRGSIRSIKSRDVSGEQTAYVGSDSPGWHLQEFGTSRTRPKAIIRRGMKTSGIRFEEGR